jgi:tetracycline 7-halogenase / FADH2 O2-dependent halogenase
VKSDYDIAIIGSGFAGSLMAMIARRLGHSVVLLERDRHPRFAIGESSTPLANLILEQLADRYDLPAIRPLSKWGTWQHTYPDLPCGLKRGFTFYSQRFDQRFAHDPVAHTGELLVAASPHNAIADTHWYRPALDQFLVTQAQSLGVTYLDEAIVTLLEESDHGVLLSVNRLPARLRARLLIDATGPRGFIYKSLSLHEIPFPHLQTQSLYAHFRNVATSPAPNGPPYPPDSAAVHHVFDGGWIWILRFANGITSAGVAAQDNLAREFSLADGSPAWNRLLSHLPSVRELFANAEPVTPFFHLPRLSFRTSRAAGESWVMLPSAAGVVDPLLSTGIPLTLLGIERLAQILEQGWNADSLARLGSITLAELDATAHLVSALYANFHDFPVFSALTLLYFAAASFSESARRLNRPDLADSFLLHTTPNFGPGFANCCNAAFYTTRGARRTALLANIHDTIAPFDIAGLNDTNRGNWYPALAKDFIKSSHKLGVTPTQASKALAKAGFLLD